MQNQEGWTGSRNWIDDERLTILENSATELWERLTEQAIKGAREMSGAGLSGEESGLDDVWEEYKDQVQNGESDYWDVFAQEILNLCKGLVGSVQRESLVLLWTLGDGYIEKQYEEGEKPYAPADCEMIDAVAKELYSLVWQVAADEMLEKERGSEECDCQSSEVDVAYESLLQTDVLSVVCDDSHFMVRLVECQSCFQRYLYVFTELIDWTDGDDSQSRSFTAVSRIEADTISQRGSKINGLEIMDLQLMGKTLWWVWPKGSKPDLHRSEGPLIVMPHD